jgi:uncharacterized protein with GYD domain
MPIFITQGKYSGDSIKGMIAKPEDRSEAVAKLVERAGGKLLAYYVTFGENDFMAITELPSHKEVSTVVLAAAATGAITDVKTTLAMTGAEAKAIFAATGALAAAYRAPGKS